MEGYYWRFTDAARGRVVIALCGVCASPTGRWAITALASHPGGTVRIAEADAAEGDSPGLGVHAGSTVTAGDARVRFDLGPDALLDVELRDGRRWPRRVLGASGIAHVVPGLGQYWHPHLLGGHVRGSLRLAQQSIDLDGATVYAEKNWGPMFPDRWWWGQADDFPSGDACVAFAGGPMRVAGVALTPTVVVVRLGDRTLALRPPAARIQATVAGGRWSIHARSLRHTVELEGEEAGSVVLPVPVPGRREWRPRSQQALAGRMSVVVRRGSRTLFRDESRLAGLERECA